MGYSMADGPSVQQDSKLYSIHDTVLKDKKETNGSQVTTTNLTASAGVEGLRPAVGIQYEKITSDKQGNSFSEDKTVVAASAPLGKPASITAYRTSLTGEDLPNGDKTIFQQGAGLKWSYGSTPEVTAAIRGDYVRQNGEGLSPYFIASAQGGGGQSPFARLEGGACIKPSLGALDVPNSCLGVYTDTNGRSGVQFRTEYKF